MLAVSVPACRITTERHRAEVRRAISDDRLAALAGWFVFSPFSVGIHCITTGHQPMDQLILS